MKILQLSKYYPPTHGGLEIVAEFMSRAVRDLGHEVTVVSLGKTDRTYEGRFGEKVLQCREDLKLSSSPLSFNYFRAARAVLKNDSPDFVFLHLPHPFAHEIAKWFRPLCRERGTKIIGVYHSDIINQVALRDAYNLHFCRHLDLYDAFVCSSPNLKASSAVLSKLPDAKVKVIPFCIDHPFGQSAPTERPFQGKFISIGRMVPYKGYEFLVKCFADLPYVLNLVGNGPLRDRLKAMAPKNVNFVGEISEAEKYQLLGQHDALIMSSINRAEAYGMTIVEAFSVGVPVIAANVDTGVSFLVRDGVTGLKFPINDATGLKRQIERLRLEAGLSEHCSREAKRLFTNELAFAPFRANMRSLIEGR